VILPAGDYDLDEGATSRVSRNSKEEGKNGAELAASCNVQQEASPLQDPRKKKGLSIVACGGNPGVYAGAPGCSPPFLYSVRNCVLPGLGLYVLSWGQGGECWFAGQTSSRPAGTFNFSVEGTREQIKFKLLPARLLDVSRNASQVALPRRALQLCTAHRALPRALSCHRMTHATHGRSVDVHGHGASSLLRSPLRRPHRTEQQQ